MTWDEAERAMRAGYVVTTDEYEKNLETRWSIEAEGLAHTHTTKKGQRQTLVARPGWKPQQQEGWYVVSGPVYRPKNGQGRGKREDCPICGKRVSLQGMSRHVEMKHSKSAITFIYDGRLVEDAD